MIYLVFGEDVKRSRELVREFEKRFVREVPAAYEIIDISIDQNYQFGARSLFADKEYLIIKNASMLAAERYDEFNSHLKRWAKDDSVIVVYEESVPEKNKIFTALKKHSSKKQEFPILKAAELERWLDGEVKKRGGSITPAQKRLLLVKGGDNLWKLERELEKMLLGGESPETSPVIEDRELFLLGDLWGRGERERAFLQYQRLLSGGFGADSILRTLLWHVKNLCLASSGQVSKMNPFVARKAREQARNFSQGSLPRAYEDLVMLDVHEKWGRGSIEFGLVKFLLTK